MFNKTMIGITAGVILSSAAFAYEDIENRLGDRYPFLEQRYAPVAVNTFRSTNLRINQVSNFVQYASEDPENKIGDRYPFLEQRYTPAAANTFAVRYPAPRLASSFNQYANEAPENKISDRYPLLEQQVASSGPTRRAVSRRTSTPVR